MQANTADPNKIGSPTNEKILGGGSEEYLRNGIWPRSGPLWMAAFYLALFIIRPWERLIPWLGEIHFERIYALCMIAAVFFSSKKRFKLTFQTVVVLLFLGSIGLSALFAIDPSLAWEGFYTYFTVVIFYFILLLVIRTPYDLVFIVTCYIVVMGVYLAKAQWEFFIHGQHSYDMGVVRLIGIESTFEGPNALAMSIVVSLPVAFFLWRFRREFSITWPRTWQKWYPRLIPIYFGLALSSIILTNSRSGMLGFIVFVLVTTFRGRGFGRKLGYAVLGAFILAITWQVMPEENKARFQTIWAPETGPTSARVSAEGRIKGFKAGITMYKRFPLTGVGIGNFIAYRVQYLDGVPKNPHNLVGQVLGESGLFGSTAFFLLVVTILANCRRARVLSKNRSGPTITVLSGLVIASRDALLLLAFEGLFSHNLLRFNWLWLAAFSTLALQYVRAKLQEKSDQGPNARR